MPDKITYKIGDDLYDVPKNESQGFIKSHPNAVEVETFVEGEDIFDVPVNEISEFKTNYPNAKSLKKKGTTTSPENLSPISETSSTTKSGSGDKEIENISEGKEVQDVASEFDDIVPSPLSNEVRGEYIKEQARNSPNPLPPIDYTPEDKSTYLTARLHKTIEDDYLAWMDKFYKDKGDNVGKKTGVEYLKDKGLSDDDLENLGLYDKESGEYGLGLDEPMTSGTYDFIQENIQAMGIASSDIDKPPMSTDVSYGRALLEGFVKGQNQHTVTTLKRLDGAEKMLYNSIDKAFDIVGLKEPNLYGGLFSHMADYVDKTIVEGLTVPDDALGDLVNILGNMHTFPFELMLTPTASSRVLSKATGGLVKEIPTLGVYLGGGAALDAYSETESPKETLKAFGTGFKDGVILHMLGGLAGKGASYFKTPLKSTGTAVGINTLGFGGLAAYDEKIHTGEVTRRNVISQSALAAALGFPAIAKAAKIYWTTNGNTIRSINNIKINATEFLKQRRTLQEIIGNKASSPEQVQEAMIALRALENTVAVKSVVEDVKSNPKAYRKTVESDTRLSKQEKQFQLDKIDYIESLRVDTERLQQMTKKTAEKPIESRDQSIATEKGKSTNEQEKPSKTKETQLKTEEGKEVAKTKIDEGLQEFMESIRGIKKVEGGEAPDALRAMKKIADGTFELGVENVKDLVVKMKEVIKERFSKEEADKLFKLIDENYSVVEGVYNEKVKRKLVIEDAEKGVRYVARESDGAISSDVFKETTDKATIVKAKEFEKEANEQLEVKRREIISDIRQADKQTGKTDYIDFNGSRYKVTPKKGGSYAVSEITTRYGDKRAKSVTNKKIRREVIKTYEERALQLSDKQMEFYESRVAEERSKLMSDADAKLRKYVNERIKTDVGKTKEELEASKGIRKKIDDSFKVEGEKKMIDTWKQFKKELRIEERASQRGATAKDKEIKERSDKLINFLKESKGELADLTPRTYDSMLKRVAEAGRTDTKLNNTINYIDKVLTDKAFREYENKRLELTAKIESETSQKKLMAKGGKRRDVKSSLKTRSGEIEMVETLDVINDLVNNGRVSSKGNVNELIRKNDKEIQRIRDKKNPTKDDLAAVGRLLHENRLLELSKVKDVEGRIESNIEEINKINEKSSISSEEVNRLFELKEENELLEFGTLDKMSNDRLQQKLDYVNNIKDLQKTKAYMERLFRAQELHEKTNKVIDIVTGGKGLPFMGGRKPVRKVHKGTIPGDASFGSLLNIMAMNDLVISKKVAPFRDRLNEMFSNPVIQSERALDSHRIKFYKERNKKIKEIWDKKLFSSRRTLMFDLSIPEKTGIEIKDVKGKAYELEMSQAQLLEKWLQWRDPKGRELMETPLEIGESGKHLRGMGYTKETMDLIERKLTPEMKEYGEWIYSQIRDVWSEIYNKAYIKEHGIGFKTSNSDYWPLSVRSITPDPSFEIGEYTPDKYLQNDRTIRRKSKAGAILNETNAFETFERYVSEASRYDAWAENLRNLNYVFKNPEVRRAIATEHGTTYLKELDYYLDAFAGRKVVSDVDIIDVLTSNAAIGLLGFKARPAVKQTISSVFYGVDMPLHRLIHGMTTGSQTKLMKGLRGFLIEQSFMEGRRSADIAAGLDLNTFIRSAGQYTEKPKVKRALSKVPRQEMSDAAGWLLKKGDRMPIIRGGAAYFKHVYERQTGKKLTLKDIEQAKKGDPTPEMLSALDAWETMSHYTQQSIRESNVSRWRGTSSFNRAVNMFTSGPAQVARMASSKLRDIRKAALSGNLPELAKGIKDFGLVWGLSGVLFELANQNFRPRSEDDLKDLGMAIFLGPTEGLAFYGRAITFAKNKFRGKPWAESGMSMSPIIDNASKYIKNSIALQQELNGEVVDKMQAKEYAIKAAVSAATLSGVPADGVIKIYGGIKKTIEGEGGVSSVLGIERYKPELVYKLNYPEMNRKKALEMLDHMMAFDKDGSFQKDEDAIMEQAKIMTKFGLDASYLIEQAFRYEQYNYYRLKYGEDYYTLEGLKKLMERDDLTDIEKANIDQRMMKMEQFDRNNEIIEAHDALLKIIEKGVDMAGMPSKEKK